MYKSSPQLIGDTSAVSELLIIYKNYRENLSNIKSSDDIFLIMQTPSVALNHLYDLLVNLSDAIEFILLMIEYNLSETIARFVIKKIFFKSGYYKIFNFIL